jgi:hypothetical protein
LSSSNHKTQSPAGVHANKPRQHHRKHHHKTQPPPTPTTVKLQLVPTAPVYVCLINGAGAKLINQQTFAPGQTIPTEKASKLLLTLGNASVQMKVNGRSVAVSPSANPIRFMIKPSGAHQIPLSTSPTCP